LAVALSFCEHVAKARAVLTTSLHTLQKANAGQLRPASSIRMNMFENRPVWRFSYAQPAWLSRPGKVACGALVGAAATPVIARAPHFRVRAA